EKTQRKTKERREAPEILLCFLSANLCAFASLRQSRSLRTSAPLRLCVKAFPANLCAFASLRQSFSCVSASKLLISRLAVDQRHRDRRRRVVNHQRRQVGANELVALRLHRAHAELNRRHRDGQRVRIAARRNVVGAGEGK